MAEIKTELTDANELNQKLYQDIEILTQEQEKMKQLED